MYVYLFCFVFVVFFKRKSIERIMYNVHSKLHDHTAKYLNFRTYPISQCPNFYVTNRDMNVEKKRS